MSRHPPGATVTVDAAIAALRRGDAAMSRRIFEALAASGRGDASVHLGLAYACMALGDGTAAQVAIDAALALDPHDLRALVFKADQLQATGAAGAAAVFYRQAADCVPQGVQLPAELQSLWARATAMASQPQQRFEAQLRAHVTQQCGEPLSARFAMSLDILAGKKQIYSQQPRQYYFPGLPQVQYFERSDFPWLDDVEAATPRIREELLSVMAQPKAFSPYVQSDHERPSKDRGGMLDNPDWSAFFLWKNGVPVEGNLARCPQTMAALAGAPLTRMSGRSPSVLFSLLRPGARIPAHHGIVNTRLIVHLPLIVPPGCEFRVGNETRPWVEGKAWVFDDTIEHEAWNPTDRTRVILLFEIWRPELTSAERAQICAMFDAIDRQRGPAPADWEI